MREGVPDRLDPVRRAGRAARAGRAPRRAAARARASPRRGSTAHDPNDGVGGDGAFFLLLDEPEVYGLPPDPVVPTRDAGAMWKFAGMAAAALVGRGGVGVSWGQTIDGARRRWRCRGPSSASYYGRPILKTPVWDWKIAAYLFAGGLSAGSALLAAGADLTGRPALRRGPGWARWRARGEHVLPGRRPRPAGAVPPHAAGGQADLADERRHLDPHGLRPGGGLAAAAELVPARLRRTWLGRLIRWLARPAGLSAAGDGAGGGVVHRGAAVAHRGAGVARGAPVPAVRVHRLGGGERRRARDGLRAARTRPARPGGWRSRAAGGAGGVTADGAAARAWSARRTPRARRTGCGSWSEYLTVGGALGAVLAGRSRAVLAVSGLALLAGSALQRFGVFEAGVESTRDPKYVVVPQRERLNAGRPARGDIRTARLG